MIKDVIKIQGNKIRYKPENDPLTAKKLLMIPELQDPEWTSQNIRRIDAFLMTYGSLTSVENVDERIKSEVEDMAHKTQIGELVKFRLMDVLGMYDFVPNDILHDLSMILAIWQKVSVVQQAYMNYMVNQTDEKKAKVLALINDLRYNTHPPTRKYFEEIERQLQFVRKPKKIIDDPITEIIVGVEDRIKSFGKTVDQLREKLVN